MRPIFFLFVFLVNSFIFSQTGVNSCRNQVSGTVINKQNELSIPNVNIQITDNDGNIIKTQADNNGSFTIDLPCDDGRYTISTSIENYTKSTKLIFTSQSINKEHRVNLEVYPIQEFEEVNGEKRILVNSIRFFPDDIGVNPEARIQLNKVSDILRKYEDLNIEIGFHADSRGGEKFLIDLTQQRADACTSYLIDKGIDASRIHAKGYGAAKLLNECEKGIKCSEAKHLINRRSEFVVLL